MNADKATPQDEQCAAWLAACDDAIAAGTLPNLEPVADSPEVQQRLQRGQGCLRLLNQAWPRQPNPAAARPWTVGRFQIVRELGRGGCGIVFLAHDPQLGRAIALKVPRAKALIDADARQRFLQEARAAGKLDHPNIV